MNIWSMVDLAVFLLKGALAAANQAGAVKVVEGIQEALAKLQEVRGTPVTEEQLKALTIEPKW